MKKKNEIIKITEKNIIMIFSRIFNSNLPKYINLKAGDDDCSLLCFKNNIFNKNVSKSFQLLCSSDMLHRETDFPLLMTYKQIGWMSFAVNLSDIAAMGGIPLAFIFSIGIPKIINLDQIQEIALGMQLCSEVYSTPIIGGDTDIHVELTINGTILGTTNGSIIKRSGASIDDLVCITGYLGLAGLALDILNFNLNNNKNNSLNFLYKYLLEPCPRIREGLYLSRYKLATSMIDTSDSLAQSLYELSSKSKVGFEIRKEMLLSNRVVIKKLKQYDIHHYLKVKNKILNYMIYTGGDFELLFTINRNKINCIKIMEDLINIEFEKLCVSNSKYDILKHKYPLKISVIGKVVPFENGITIINNKNITENIFKEGYDPFV